ncbi:MAG: branched-chain amino acid transport permease [Chloroflexi bacterium GWB2_49_20]|nr:MAG: branched-chain amino acid transport permease [Chloroflexi bacterium GWB2_49_20]OGN77327.1 MAG: branched-chain amino acid transport permease [Chloroflexi bacterium GWC2_49_37]OGN84657.1 MAG: branched-chain amino acid transport permease [Chloroflexi bacterium GWD2_49_16]HBG74834.1 branched-chain amino acid ABC transporter permease [Anaerolineae bacterium]HCC77997.1 branched-chain amino acid ABC transporter permease [Anaerolineae bacterium]
MQYFLSLCVTGLVMGVIYALMALGLTLIFSILKVVNFAHGEFYMLGGYTSYFLLSAFTGLHPILAVLLSGLIVGVIGLIFELVFLRPIHKGKIERPSEYAVLVTVGLSFFLIYLSLALAGPVPHRPASFLTGTVSLGTVNVSAERLIAGVFSLVLLGLLLLVINKTWVGKALRAVSQDKDAASIVGINPLAMNSIAFAVGAGLAAIAGALLAPIFSVTPDIGAAPSIRSYIIIVLGGMGSIQGSILGAVLIGLVESLGTGYFPDPSRALNYKMVFGLIIFAFVLLFRPRGFFGRKET